MPVAILRVERPGLLTTIQDLGRPGHQREGVAVGGMMDPFALQIANLLVGNRRGDAALEITLLGPTLHVLNSSVIAVCGADLSARLDDVSLPLWKSVPVRPGQVLSFGKPRAGARACLAIAGGVAVPRVMGSRSTFLRGGLGGFQGRALRAGDVLESETPARDWEARAGRGLAPAEVPHYPQTGAVRVILGPQETAFTPEGLRTFLSAAYEVTHQSDRMGCRLAGPRITHKPSRADILSEAVPWGAVQVPADGQPLILTADRQTTGGYAKIAVVVSADLSQVAQLAPGHRLTFRAISVAEAHALLRAQERRVALLAAALGPAGLA